MIDQAGRKQIFEILGRLPRDPAADASRLDRVIGDLLSCKAEHAIETTAFAAEVSSALVDLVASGEVSEDTSARVLSAILTGQGPTDVGATSGQTVPRPWSHLHRLVWDRSEHESRNECLNALMQQVTEALEVDATTLFLKDEATEVLVLRAASGLETGTYEGWALRLGRGISGRAAQRQQSINAADAPGHPDFHDHSSLTDELFSSQLSTPLLVHQTRHLVGVINVHTRAPRLFTREEVEFLETVASVLAISVHSFRQSSRTDERLQQKVSELATLQRVSRVIASTLDLSEVLKLIAEQAFELVQAEAAAIFRLSYDQPETGVPHPSVEYRIGPPRSHRNEAVRDAIVADVLRTGVGRSVDISYEDGISNVFCLPLNTARETVGALCFRLRHGTTLNDETLGLLQAFGDAAAIAIENARLYQDAIRSIETQSALVQEMHHRVRNNLQTVAALLSLQLRSEQDASWSFELREAVTRIQAIAGVHDLLSDESRLGGTTVDVIARMVAEDAHSTLIPPGLSIRFNIPESELIIPSRQATIIALLVNELAANAIHHGFKGRSRGEVTITGTQDDCSAVIQVANDGVQIAEGFDPESSTGLGMRISQRLVSSDLGGTFTIEPTDQGTLATIRFPIAQLNETEPYPQSM